MGSEDDRLDTGASLTSVAPDLDAAEGNHIRMLEEVDRFHEHPPTSTERESKKVDSSSSADANKSTSVAIGNALELPDRPIPVEHVLQMITTFLNNWKVFLSRRKKSWKLALAKASGASSAVNIPAVRISETNSSSMSSQTLRTTTNTPIRPI